MTLIRLLVLACIPVAIIAGCGGGDSCGEDFVVRTPTDVCAGQGEVYDTYNVFWSAFDQRYALFVERDPGDWDAIGADGCALLSTDMEDDELFDMLIELAERFDDGHIQLESERRDGDGWTSEYVYYGQMRELPALIASEYLGSPLTVAAMGEVMWARTESLGYIALTSMDELSSRGDEGPDRRAMARAMVQALTDLDGVNAIVVDVRANEGGWDTTALEAASFFAGEPTLAWSEQLRTGGERDAFEEWREVETSGRTDAFDGPVVVLTSGGTFSAAETFTLAMRVRPQVRLVGERTSGHYSDLFCTCLPNAWILCLSGERYRAADGEFYEGRGTPVDVEIAFDPAAFAQGRDVMFEAAIDSLGVQL